MAGSFIERVAAIVDATIRPPALCLFRDAAMRPFDDTATSEIRKWLLATTLFFGLYHPGSAAQIVNERADNGALIVGILGQINPDDDDAFDRIVAGHSEVVVGLNSPGGSLMAGLNIGATIHNHGYATMVIDDTTCASSCALIWLAGSPRIMGPKARIGFHAASWRDGSVTGDGNALIGAYLTKLGLSYQTVVYLTEAQPDSITWLHPFMASTMGIAVKVLDPEPVRPPPVATPVLARPPVTQQQFAAPAPAASRVGPSNDCGKADTPLMQFICADADLSRTDVEMVQPYYVLRHQVGPSGWQALMVEAINFQTQTASYCGIVNDILPADGAALKICLSGAYRRQRSVWLARLSGDGRQEAVRPIDQHMQLQAKLQMLGFIASTDKIDGIFSTGTRAAITAWQTSAGFPATGLLGDTDASRLTASSQGATTVPMAMSVPSTFQQGLTDRQAWEAWLAGTKGNYHLGAFFWSAQRSLLHPASCYTLFGDAAAGCLAAKVRLDPTDVRRKADPTYRAGWNNYTP